MIANYLNLNKAQTVMPYQSVLIIAFLENYVNDAYSYASVSLN